MGIQRKNQLISEDRKGLFDMSLQKVWHWLWVSKDEKSPLSILPLPHTLCTFRLDYFFSVNTSLKYIWSYFFFTLRTPFLSVLGWLVSLQIFVFIQNLRMWPNRVFADVICLGSRDEIMLNLVGFLNLMISIFTRKSVSWDTLRGM